MADISLVAQARLRAQAEHPLTITLTRQPGPGLLARWDDLVAATPHADVTQLSSWARLRESVGFTPLYLLAARDGELLGGAQVLVRRMPVVGAAGYLPYGPLVGGDDAETRRAAARAVSGALARVGRDRLRMLFVQPPEGADDVRADLRRHGFRPSSAGIAPSGSLRVDLRVDEAALLRGLTKRLRTWTRRWPDRGVRVRRGDEGDLDLLVTLMSRSAAHQGYQPLAGEYVRELYRLLAPGGHAVLFLAEVEGDAVAAELFTACGGTLRGRLCGLDRTGPAARLSCAAAITWEAMRWARSQGFTWFDFGGLREETLDALLDPPPGGATDAAVPGVDRYKMAFGGSAYRYPAPVELIRSPAVRAGYDLARQLPAGRRLLNHLTRRARGART